VLSAQVVRGLWSIHRPGSIRLPSDCRNSLRAGHQEPPL
jgi:hypothetical protein